MKLNDYINERIEGNISIQIAIDNVLEEVYESIQESGVRGVEEWGKKNQPNINEEVVDEGFLGGAIGFLTGPAIGKIVARALGVEKGVLYDMLTSRLVSLALGNAIQKAMK